MRSRDKAEVKSLREWLETASDCAQRHLWGASATVTLSDLVHRSSLGEGLRELSGRSVLVATHDHLATALALIEADGVAKRLVICPPGLSKDDLRSVIADGAIDAVVSDTSQSEWNDFKIAVRIGCRPIISEITFTRPMYGRTEWVLLTSGTTGLPKMASYSLEALIGAIDPSIRIEPPPIWATFFDLRRFGGLQIFFRAILSNGSLVLSDPDASLGDFLARLATHKASHIHGTPSHWRRVLLNPLARAIAPKYIRLSGEIADQAILDALHTFYPEASIVHAYASTEAGVGFEVDDRLEGFPAEFIDDPKAVELKVVDSTLRIRSSRTASGYVGFSGVALKDDDGFVDSGDIVERRGNRYYFLGRDSGVINVGGLKVHPEEVEAVINLHPAVRMSLVHARRNSMLGSIVVADVVLARAPSENEGGDDIKQEILRTCREKLLPYKIPATVRFVPSLNLNASGKLVRNSRA
jgi:acyl-CoA synthetase (AMP-forming)/AMP-acid ligase II